VWVTVGHRKTSIASLTLDQVQELPPDAVRFASRTGLKKRTRAVIRRRSARNSEVVAANWRIQHFLLPWLRWRRSSAMTGDELCFPSMVRDKNVRATRSASGRMVDGGLWCEPHRLWTAPQVICGLDFALGRGRRLGRTTHGFRFGNLQELEQLAKNDATLRARIQGRKRSSRAFPSEEGYSASVAEDMTDVTRRLGSLRIIPSGEDMISISATSVSAGRLDDWVPSKRHTLIAVPSCSHASPSDSEDSNDFPSSFDCFKCGTRVEHEDETGGLCDTRHCQRGLCGTCRKATVDDGINCPDHS